MMPLAPKNSTRTMPFPEVRRMAPISKVYTPVSIYHIRMDRTPPQHELFSVCIISEDSTAYLKTFEMEANSYTFVAPTMNVSSVLLSPLDSSWNMSHVDLEVKTRADDDSVTSTLKRYLHHDGAIETNCLFLPERPFDEEAYREGIQEYSRHKEKTNTYTVCFLVGGSVLYQATSGPHSAFVFIFGCVVGIIYQLLLQHEVDRLGKNIMLINSAGRLAIIAVGVAAIMNSTAGLLPADLWIGLSGFLMQKVAMLIAFT